MACFLIHWLDNSVPVLKGPRVGRSAMECQQKGKGEHPVTAGKDSHTVLDGGTRTVEEVRP